MLTFTTVSLCIYYDNTTLCKLSYRLDIFAALLAVTEALNLSVITNVSLLLGVVSAFVLLITFMVTTVVDAILRLSWSRRISRGKTSSTQTIIIG